MWQRSQAALVFLGVSGRHNKTRQVANTRLDAAENKQTQETDHYLKTV